VPEAVGDTGVLVNPINIDELKRTIVDLLHNRRRGQIIFKRVTKKHGFLAKNEQRKNYIVILSIGWRVSNESINYRWCRFYWN
jgi:hypothetical protein